LSGDFIYFWCDEREKFALRMNLAILMPSCECQALEFSSFKLQRLLEWARPPDCGKQDECSDLTPLPVALYVRITPTSTTSILVGHKTVSAQPKVILPDQKDPKLLRPTYSILSGSKVGFTGDISESTPS